MPGDRDLLEVEEVATYLGVGNVTVHRWCRDGRLPCFKVGRLWRIRRQVLEEFMERGERPQTLVGQLRSFLQVPDNVLVVAQDRELMHRLDAAFFRVGEARGGMLVKFHPRTPKTDLEELIVRLEDEGLRARELEEMGRLRFIADRSEPGERLDQLGQLLTELEDEENSRSIWVAFNWEERVNLDEALGQQLSLTRFVEGSSLTVKTSVLEETLDRWPVGSERRAQLMHSGSIWLSEDGMLLSRVSPSPDHRQAE